MKRLFFAAIIAVFSLWGSQSALAQAAPAVAKYRVVFQVSNPDPRGWNQALNNSLALTRNAGRAKVQIRIAFKGRGLLKQDSPAARRVAAARAPDVQGRAGGGTMKTLRLEKEDMLPDIGYVPGGVIEILDRQSEGWRYIKADCPALVVRQRRLRASAVCSASMPAVHIS